MKKQKLAKSSAAQLNKMKTYLNKNLHNLLCTQDCHAVEEDINGKKISSTKVYPVIWTHKYVIIFQEKELLENGLYDTEKKSADEYTRSYQTRPQLSWNSTSPISWNDDGNTLKPLSES